WPIDRIKRMQVPSESAGTGLTSLKRKRRAFDNTYHSMPFACASGLLQATSPASAAYAMHPRAYERSLDDDAFRRHEPDRADQAGGNQSISLLPEPPGRERVTPGRAGLALAQPSRPLLECAV